MAISTQITYLQDKLDPQVKIRQLVLSYEFPLGVRTLAHLQI